MKSKLWIIFVMGFLLMPSFVFAYEETTPIEQLNDLSDEALQLTKSHRYEDAKKILEVFSDTFSSFTVQEHVFSMDELRIVSLVHNEAIEAMTAATMDPNEKINQVTKFRLVIDAISTTKQPLWTEMESPIMSVYNAVKEAALNGEQEAFHENFNTFLGLYDMVYPSMKVDVPTEKFQHLDTRIEFIDHSRSKVLTNLDAKQELLNLETDLRTIFEGLTEDESDPSIWWVIISTGSIIIMTLSYVGWRKYKGEKERSKNPSRY